MPIAEMDRHICRTTYPPNTKRAVDGCDTNPAVQPDLSSLEKNLDPEVIAQVSKIIKCMVLGGEFYLGNPNDSILAIILMQKVPVSRSFENLHKPSAQAQLRKYLQS